jgi:hypothetical protein
MSDLESSIASLIDAARPQVWVPSDFAHLGSRDAVDKNLQRMVLGGDLRRIGPSPRRSDPPGLAGRFCSDARLDARCRPRITWLRPADPVDQDAKTGQQP